MRIEQIIRAAMPEATDADCEHVLWGMTPFPAGAVSARTLYRAASRARRASQNGILLCDWCDNKRSEGRGTLCESCWRALNTERENAA